jgi:hypothetical protein
MYRSFALHGIKQYTIFIGKSFFTVQTDHGYYYELDVL